MQATTAASVPVAGKNIKGVEEGAWAEDGGIVPKAQLNRSRLKYL